MNIARLHFVTSACNEIEEQVDSVCRAGVKWIQVRLKGLEFDEWKERSAKALSVCKHYGAICIINDNPKIAKEIGADGVHLGQSDMSPVEARDILGNKAIIGGTANKVDQIFQLAKHNVNYIGLGPLRFTTTKEKLSPILGLFGIEKIMEDLEKMRIKTPVIVIGGVAPTDIKPLREFGVHGVAVSSGISGANDVKLAAERFLQEGVVYG